MTFLRVVCSAKDCSVAKFQKAEDSAFIQRTTLKVEPVSEEEMVYLVGSDNLHTITYVFTALILHLVDIHLCSLCICTRICICIQTRACNLQRSHLVIEVVKL